MENNNSGKQKALSGSELHSRIRILLSYLNENLSGKEEALRFSLLSAVAGESILLLGQPGRDKSLISRCIASAFSDFYKDGFFNPGDDYIEYFMNGTETGAEFGEAKILFLDDIWSSSPAVLNKLIKIMNKEDGCFSTTFLVAGSSEADPYKAAESKKLEALRESFALHVAVKPISNDDDFFKFVNNTNNKPQPNETQKTALLSINEIYKWQPIIDRVELSEDVRNVISEIRRKCFDYYVSDSRWKKIVRILKTCAFLNGRNEVDLMDCSLIDYAIPHRFVEEILKQHAVDCKLDGRQHVQYKMNIFARQKYYEILKASIDDTKLKLEHKEELY